MKKILGIVLALVMVFAMSGIAMADEAGYSGELKVWVSEESVGYTQELVDMFKAANPEYADMTVVVQPVGEGDAASNMITDVEAGADIYTFAHDQLARLVAAGALEIVEENNAAAIAAENVPGAVEAVTLGGTMYAYPITADNGYFLYYDKSVVTDPSTLEAILADCEAAGKNFYMELNSGWYDVAFFFGAGCTLTYDVDDEGAFTACNVDYASDNGVRALKAMINLAKSPAFVNGSSASNASDIGAIVDGPWDAKAVQGLLGDNYAACKLPTVDGFQMGGFGGYKMIGVKPQTDEAKLAACDALAAYLSSEEAQLYRFKAVEWGPSNMKAAEDEAVQSNIALAAIADQMKYCVVQGQYPGEYWSLATALGDDVIGDKLDNATDEELMAVLTTFEETVKSYAAN